MKSALVLTVVGPDRPGLVEALAATVAEHGGNWEQSRMARLGGQFAGILRLQVPSERIAELRAAFGALGSRGLRVVSDTVDDGHNVAAPEQHTFQLEVVGNDREGIVREVSRVLAAAQVNVESLETACESAPMSGALLFRATAVLSMPAATDIAKLQKQLENIADDLMVDAKLIPNSGRG